MKRLLTGKSLAVLAALAVIGSATVAAADRRGDDRRWHNRCPQMQGIQLTNEQIQKLNEERAKFHSITQDVRQQLHEKELFLRAEFAKKNPDAATAASIQKEISELNSKMDQMRLEHRLEMKKIDPALGSGGHRWRDNRECRNGKQYHHFR